jgi:hypothetical protein
MQSDSSAAAWTLKGRTARLQSEQCTASFDLQRPGGGLRDLRLGNVPLDGSVLALGVLETEPAPQHNVPPWTPADTYVRGNDLVAMYHEPLGQPYWLELYLRLTSDNELSGPVLEAMVSLQTRQWEAYPAVTLSSAIRCGQVETFENFAIYGLEDHGCYVEAALPEDFQPVRGSSGGATGVQSVSWRFGGHFMERGVIRRLRLRCALAPPGDSRRAAALILAQLRSEPPPLTA